MAAASRATSVPAAHRDADVRRLQRWRVVDPPSPVIATTSPLALKAWMMRSFCSGSMRANTVVWRTRRTARRR
jgi:hypothetical protein